MKMNKGLVTLIVIAVIGLILYFVFSGTYNKMVKTQEDTTSKWAQVESQYQRRMDLYNSVVKVIESSAEFEKSTLIEVVEARSKASSINVDAEKLTPESIQAFQSAQDNMSSSFGRLLVVIERYPELQTTQAMRDFQAQIEGTENRINKARDDFNLSVQGFNTYIKTFPNNMIAGMFGFTAKGYFESKEGADTPPDTSIDIK